MKRELRRWEIVGFIATGLFGTLLHFVYEWTGGNRVIAVFSAVNESTWEHMKLLFIPFLVFTVVEFIVFSEAFRNFFAVKAATIILDVLLCNGLLKPLVARIRPCNVVKNINMLIPIPKDFSFPSGHTAVSFAVTSALYFCKNKIWIPSVLLFFLIAFSRMYLYVHYPSDILGGVVLGILVGKLAYDFGIKLGEKKKGSVAV